MSIPCGFDRGGLPIGLQIQGNYFAEAQLLNVAHRFQQATDWHARARRAEARALGSAAFTAVAMNWEVVIGLETHAQLSTASKIFSGASTAFGAAPNTQASAVDIALPGVLPVLNRGAVERAIRFGLAVGAHDQPRAACSRARTTSTPTCRRATRSRSTRSRSSRAAASRSCRRRAARCACGSRARTSRRTPARALHEDFHGMTGIDLNRAGTPLLEIVSEPDLRSSDEAVAYAKALHALVRWIGICDGNMQEGSFRCDANVSVRPAGRAQLGTRCEIKNLNSFRFMQEAIDFEVRRQIELIEDGGTVVQETRLYDPDRDETRSMRSKEDAQDYRYFPDPDLPPLVDRRRRGSSACAPRCPSCRRRCRRASSATTRCPRRRDDADREPRARRATSRTSVAGARRRAPKTRRQLDAGRSRRGAQPGGHRHRARARVAPPQLAGLLAAHRRRHDLRQDRQGRVRRDVGRRARRRRRRDHRGDAACARSPTKARSRRSSTT